MSRMSVFSASASGRARVKLPRSHYLCTLKYDVWHGALCKRLLTASIAESAMLAFTANAPTLAAQRLR